MIIIHGDERVISLNLWRSSSKYPSYLFMFNSPFQDKSFTATADRFTDVEHAEREYQRILVLKEHVEDWICAKAQAIIGNHPGVRTSDNSWGMGFCCENGRMTDQWRRDNQDFLVNDTAFEQLYELFNKQERAELLVRLVKECFRFAMIKHLPPAKRNFELFFKVNGNMYHMINDTDGPDYNSELFFWNFHSDLPIVTYSKT